MADPFRGHVEGRAGCASYRVLFNGNHTMVVRNGHWRGLRTSLQSCDLSCKRRAQIGRRAVCDSEWDYHGSIDWPFYRHLGGQNELANRLEPTQPLVLTPTVKSTVLR